MITTININSAAYKSLLRDVNVISHIKYTFTLYPSTSSCDVDALCQMMHMINVIITLHATIIATTTSCNVDGARAFGCIEIYCINYVSAHYTQPHCIA